MFPYTWFLFCCPQARRPPLDVTSGLHRRAYIIGLPPAYAVGSPTGLRYWFTIGLDAILWISCFYAPSLHLSRCG